MILDKKYLEVKKLPGLTMYSYKYPSDNKKIMISLGATNSEKGLDYAVGKQVSDLEDNPIVELKDTLFYTTDLKAAWEKFEDYFEETQKEENPQQQGQGEPEVQVLMLTVEKSGKSFVFLLKQDGTQELVLELDINDSNVKNNKPKFAELDFTNDPNLTEPFNTKWNLALVEDVQYENASKDSTTFIVAMESVNQPGQEGPGEPGESGESGESGQQGQQGQQGQEKTEQGNKGAGESSEQGEEQGKKPNKQGEKQDSGEQGEKQDSGEQGGKSEEEQKEQEGQEGKPQKGEDNQQESEKQSDDSNSDTGGDLSPSQAGSEATVQKVDYKGIVSQLSKETGLSPDDIESSLRTERIFDSFLNLNNINVNELKNKFNASSLTRNQFVKQVVNDFKNI